MRVGENLDLMNWTLRILAQAMRVGHYPFNPRNETDVVRATVPPPTGLALSIALSSSCHTWAGAANKCNCSNKLVATLHIGFFNLPLYWRGLE